MAAQGTLAETMTPNRRINTRGKQAPGMFSHQDGCPSNPVNIACERGHPIFAIFRCSSSQPLGSAMLYTTLALENIWNPSFCWYVLYLPA